MAELCPQVHLKVEDKVGKLDELTAMLAEAGVNIRGAAAWVEGTTGHMMMVADDCDKACATLGKDVDSCDCHEVVCVNVSNEVGALNKIAHTLSESGIAINVLYASAAGGESLIVLNTSDNTKAAELI